MSNCILRILNIKVRREVFLGDSAPSLIGKRDFKSLPNLGGAAAQIWLKIGECCVAAEIPLRINNYCSLQPLRYQIFLFIRVRTCTK